MRYFTWKLVWSDGYGYGPEQTAHDNGGKLMPSMWVNPSVETGPILGYATDGLDLGLFAEWEAAELTQTEALAFAKNIDATAYIMENGIIARIEDIEF